MRLLSPIAAFFTMIANAVVKLFSKEEADPSFTEEELKEILDTVEEEGVLDEEQGDMLKSALEFGDTVVGDIMTMARDMEILNVAAPTSEVLHFIRDAKHSRIPVYAGTPDRIIGTLRTRAFLTKHHRNPNVKVRDMLAAPRFVRENAKIDDVLTEMRQHKQHIALVRDEHKKILGLVTIEDILEELVGEIFDEEDVVDRNCQALGGDKYLVNTHILMGTLYERAGLYKAPRGVAGKPVISIILETLGRMPEQDESFLYDRLEFTVDTMENDRPTYVTVHFLDDEELAERLAPADGKEVEA
jgi:CBS domain containing-hemolysin-like protein